MSFKSLFIDGYIYFTSKGDSDYHKATLTKIEITKEYMFIEATYSYQYKPSDTSSSGYTSTDNRVIRIPISKVDSKNMFAKMAWYSGKREDKEFDREVFVCIGEGDMIRYCKTLLLGTLRHKIDLVKSAYDAVVEFKTKNYQLLSNDWIEEEIVKLENKYRQL